MSERSELSWRYKRFAGDPWNWVATDSTRRRARNLYRGPDHHVPAVLWDTEQAEQ